MDQQKTAGATAAVANNGNDKAAAPTIVNPHNPEFITKKPWYLGDATDEPTLEHQSAPTLNKKAPLSLSASEALVSKQRAVSDKFEKGQWVEALKKNKMPYRICQILAVNARQTEFDLKFEDGTIEKRVKLIAGASRPRVRKTQRGSRSANVTDATGMTETYDSKRDAYHGYDQESHNARLTARFQEREAIRRKMRESLKGQRVNDDDDDDDDDDNHDDDDDHDNNNHKNNKNDGMSNANAVDKEFMQRDEDDKVITTRLARQGGVGGAQMKVTARNLRIREDTAKYLRNLDPNSAYYDPKSRSMRDNPNPEIAPEESQFAGDNYARISGDAVQLADTHLFAWEAAEQGVEQVHPQANPSQVELLKRQYRAQATDLQLQKKRAVLEKYGGEEYLDGTGGLAAAVADSRMASPARNLRFGVSTQVELYTPDGRRMVASGETRKPQRRAIPCKYEEDVFLHGHTTVWGSYFHKGAFSWGYADDHSLIKMSYCTGETGRLANDEANELRYGTGQAGSAALAQARQLCTANAATGSQTRTTITTQLYGEADPYQKLDPDKVQAAMARSDDANQDWDDRKRKYHSRNVHVDWTKEDMEVYRLKKNRGAEDPMSQQLPRGKNDNDDELLDYKS